MTALRDALVLGIGNLLWSDEGFGVRAVEALNQAFRFPDGVELMDGGTLGLGLLPYVESSRRVLVFDAVDYGLAPGTLKVLRGAEVPAWGARKMSPHQNGFNDVLALAHLHGCAPEEIVAIGVQPQTLDDFGGSLTEPVRARLDEAVALAAAELARWGLPGTARGDAPARALNDAAVGLASYEGGRPSEEDACRIGDERLLRQPRAGS
jgi:hydrogenase maturation protease